MLEVLKAMRKLQQLGCALSPALAGFSNAPHKIVLLSSCVQVYVTCVLQRQDASTAVFESLFLLVLKLV